MQIDIVKNAKRNIAVGFINKIVALVCPFIERIVIQCVLGSQYLGLGSLYTSIISVLSLSELGFSTALIYNMYKPAAEGNIEMMNALLNFYRKVYRIIGLIILCVGLVIIPFLPKLINGSYPDDIDLIIIYLIYLFNSVISYFLFAYLSAVVVVHQRDDIISTVNSVIKIGLTVSQIAILINTKNYYLFSLIMPLFSILNNVLIGWRVRILFPQYKPIGDLQKAEKKTIRKLVTGTFIQRACDVTRNSLDSICISIFLGLTLTAIYNNYYLIITGLNSVVMLIASSFMGGIGNHVTTRSIEENYLEMKRLDFVYLWIGGWCTICMLCMYQPFMQIWMGKDMILPMSNVVFLCIYFYLLKLGDVRSMYSSANGLWWKQRYRAICETLANLFLNIALGKMMGITGIILATILSLFFFGHIWGVSIMFDNYFTKKRIKLYYVYQAKQSLVVIVAGAITYFICINIQIENCFYTILFRCVICLIIPNLLFILIYRKTEQFNYVRQIINNRKM